MTPPAPAIVSTLTPDADRHTIRLFVSCLLLLPLLAQAEPRVVKTTVIGPFTGAQAPLHPDNVSPHRVKYMGTDLGWTYEHEGQLHFIFGDTAASAGEEAISYSFV